jgi:hypothetical protein
MSIVGRTRQLLVCAPMALVALVALAGSTVAPRPLHAQPRQGPVVHAKGAKSRGAANDPNVKSDSLPANHVGADVTAPPSKGGPKTRGAMSGVLHVDNRTPWVIRIYVDGSYVGNVGRFGDSYGYYGCSVRSLYARAYFDDGSVTTWGPARRDLCDDFTWELDP